MYHVCVTFSCNVCLTALDANLAVIELAVSSCTCILIIVVVSLIYSIRVCVIKYITHLKTHGLLCLHSAAYTEETNNTQPPVPLLAGPNIETRNIHSEQKLKH